MLLEALRLVVGVVLLAWLPGHAWRRLLLPSWRGLQAWVADVMLSVALVIVVVLALHTVVDAPVSVGTAVWTSLALTFAAAAGVVAQWLSRLEINVRE